MFAIELFERILILHSVLMSIDSDYFDMCDVEH